jgi:hypothetical protein
MGTRILDIMSGAPELMVHGTAITNHRRELRRTYAGRSTALIAVRSFWYKKDLGALG